MKKMKLCWTVLCFSLLAIVGTAQVAESPLVAEKEAVENVKSLLWEITGNDLKEPSYLYGTIHMIPKEDFFLTEATKDAFKKVEKVTFEIDMKTMNDFSVLFSIIGQIMMDGGTTIKDLVTPEEYELIKTHFEAIGLPFFLFEKVKPLFLSTFISGDMGADGLSSGKIVSYEMEFMKMAEEKEYETDGLETIAFQMSVFDSIPYKDQAKMLVESINADGAEDSQFDEMVEMYKKQDIDEMVRFMSGEEGFESYEDVLLTKRNKNWIPLMAEMMKLQPTFFAVGAGHLGGKNGVIELLKAEGYTLTAKP